MVICDYSSTFEPFQYLCQSNCYHYSDCNLTLLSFLNIDIMGMIDSRNFGRFCESEGRYDKSRNICLPQNRPLCQPEVLTPVYHENHQKLGFCCQSNELKMSSENQRTRLLRCMLLREYNLT